ncbi:MAG: RNA polymerase sigma factor (sigma-70 family) [Saprospiraceae bacterium]|jgi:RNA polymerase sigma factor (sigma-70 family)
MISVSDSKEEIEKEILKLLRNKATYEKGIERLMLLYQEAVYWQIRRMVDRHEDAADLSQEVWINVFRKLDSFRGGSAIYTWIYRVTVNTCLNFIKKEKRKPKSGFFQSELSEGQVSHEIDSERIWNLLQESVRLLPEKQQMVFNLRYFEEKKYKEISQLLNTSEGALKASYHLAVKKIEAYVRENIPV